MKMQAVGKLAYLFSNEAHTKETHFMKSTWHGCFAFCLVANEARISIVPFLSDGPSRDNGWSGYLTGENSTQGGER